MNGVDRVKAICKERKIPLSKLERDLGYGNGYIGQLRKGVFPSDRLMEIANYLQVSTNYILTGAEKSAPTGNGGRTEYNDFNLSLQELNLIHKFRRLDERGRSTVINTLEHEYSALPQATRSEGVSPADNSRSILRIAARDGSYQERILSDHQVADLQAFLDQLPDVPEGL